MTIQQIPATPPPHARPTEAQLQVICADAPFKASEISVARAVGELLQVVRESLDLEVVFVGEITGGRRYFRHVNATVPPAPIAEGDSHAVEATLCQRVLDGRLPPLIPNVRDIALDPALAPEIAQLTTHIGVPVHLPDGRLYGMLCGFNLRECTPLDARDVRRLEVAAQAAARLLAQADGSALDASVELAWA